MSRAIDGDALSDWMKDYGQKCIKGEREISLMYVWKHIQDMPTIEPERKKGTWIEYDNSHCECPFCHEEWSYFDNETEYFNYCPNCGAEMTEESEEPKRCDTCKHEKEPWTNGCSDCFDYELWEEKDETGRSTNRKETDTTG